MRLDGCHGDRQGSGRGGREETGSSGLAHWLFHDAAGIGSPMDLCFPAEYEKTKENESEVPANRIHPQTACKHMEVPRQCAHLTAHLPIHTYPYPIMPCRTDMYRQQQAARIFGEGRRIPFFRPKIRDGDGRCALWSSTFGWAAHFPMIFDIRLVVQQWRWWANFHFIRENSGSLCPISC